MKKRIKTPRGNRRLNCNNIRLLREGGRLDKGCDLYYDWTHRISAYCSRKGRSEHEDEHIFKEDVSPKQYVEDNGLAVVNDEGALRSTIEEIVANNPQSVEDYKNGKQKAIGFLVGQTMKAMKGKADPGMVNQILKELLDK